MEQKIRLQAKKYAAAILVAAMAVSLIPKITGAGTVLAAGTKDGSNTCLGTSGIAAPSAPGSGWNGSYVYFGHNGTGGDPIKFRVSAPSTTAYGGSTLFLDSDATLFNKSFDDDSNVWANSELRTYLNGEFLTGGSFTYIEQGVIAASTVSSHELVVGTGAGQVASWTKDNYGQYVALNGDKIFVLDAEEASNAAYGYSNTDENCSDRVKGGSSASWWLRSAISGSSYGAGRVYSVGYLRSHDVASTNNGVAPALNINQSSIIFSSLISGSFNTAGAEYKLTIADDNLSIAVPAGQEVTATGTTITVPYQIGGADAGTAPRASVLILDKAYGTSGAQILYYDALGGTFSNSTAATGTFTLPTTLDIADWGTDYYVYILAEDVNGTYETDYASAPFAIDAPAGAIATNYTVTYSVVNGTWADGTTADKTETVASGASPASIPTGMIASSGYTGGSWDTDPASATITGNTTFTYTFESIPTYTVTYSVANGTWSDGTTADKTETVQSGSAPASVPTGMIAASGYTGGSWDTDPASAAITGNTTFTYTFEAIPTYTVTYSVANGTWSDGTTADKTETVQSESAPASVPTDMIAASGYTAGSWDTDPASVTITGNTTFTYTFEAIPTYTVTYSVVNGTWSDGSTTNKTETVQSGSAPASVPTGMIAASGYTGGSWDTDPASAAITGNTTFTYTFEAIPTYTITYSVANGTWSDGTTADKTETVQSGSAPASVPTGMIADSGYTGGSWDTDPASATITGNTTFTYTFEAIPVYYTVAGGGNSTFTIGDASDLVITVKRNVADDTCFSHFIGIEIDGKALVSGTDYTAVAGSTVVTIKAATLNRLSAGGHTITIVFDDGKIETSVTAKAASGTSNGGSAVPSTGESLAPTLFIGIAFVAVAGTLFTVMLVQKKRKSVR